MNTVVKVADRFISVDGVKIRYLEQGTGVPAILFHGGALGSSADGFRRNLPVLAAGGIRAIAVDSPGYGKSDQPEDMPTSLRRNFPLRFMDALGLEKAAWICHSQSGGAAVPLALAHPERVSHMIILGSGGLLPPLDTDSGGQVGGREEAAQDRLEERMTHQEPRLEDTRAMLEAILFHHELITDEELALRHEVSIGACFQHFLARRGAGNGARREPPAVPNWQRLVELEMPLLLIYGREDRARAEERATLLKTRYPQLNLHFATGCKHLVNWDAADLFHELAVPMITA